MKLLFVSAGARACGKSWALSRLAYAMPGAVLIEQHPKYNAEHGRHYRDDQHIENPFTAWPGGEFTLDAAALRRLKDAKSILLATDAQTATKKIEALQAALGPRDVIWVTSLPTGISIKDLGGPLRTPEIADPYA